MLSFLEGLVAVAGTCFCGFDAVATCLRCGERRCHRHYSLSGPAGPACDVCRAVDAQNEADAKGKQARALIQRFLAAPSLASAPGALGASSLATDQNPAVLAAIAMLAKKAPTLRVLTVQLEPHPRYNESRASRTEPVTRILSLARAITTNGIPIVSETGQAFHPMSDFEDAVEVRRCTVYIANQSGTLPTFRYLRREQGGWYDSQPQPARWSFSGQVRLYRR
ncbi:hypothetical protein ABH935_006195 [Catenulispora sp. GAS73]|uniref:hypothetical protein n=1 Tax=Catenulispora sp. GAS73 TaxID=3156269 RepID=UPI0035186738